MNKKQKIVGYVGVTFFIVFSLLLTPVTMTHKLSSEKNWNRKIHSTHPIYNMPDGGMRTNVDINYKRVLFGWAVISVSTFSLIYLLKE